MTIKHIVIPAGGVKGFHYYGALKSSLIVKITKKANNEL